MKTLTKGIDYMPKKALKALENETLETLTQHGRRCTCSTFCRWAGVSPYGTVKQRATRLLEWKEKQL